MSLVMTRSNQKLRRKQDARQTREDEACRDGGAGGGTGYAKGVWARYGDAAIRQRRTAAGAIPAEAPDDRPDQPAAAARDPVLHLQRRPDHAEQRVFRPLSSRRHS